MTGWAAVLRGSLSEHLGTTDNVQPMLPSRLTASSFCASTANSIGSFCSTALQKPLTIDRHRLLLRDPALAAVEQLVVGDLRGRRLVLDLRERVPRLDVGKRVRAAAVADQERVALRVVARAAAPLRILTRPR